KGCKSMKKIGFAVAIFVPLFLMTSCSKETPEKAETHMSSEDVKRETGEAFETTKTYLKQEKEKYQKGAESTLNDLNDKIKGLQAKAEQAGSDTKAKYNEIIEGLQKRQGEAQNKLNDLKSKSADAWEDVKSGMDAALENLKNSYNDAVSHFK
ncbi:MAG: apolipoprotein A1/A4/E family protein, partial [Candidatus Kuenenia sp.]|nr:apolipoprotein A1/A4/E family protein [Candidatus Kuenenia sp.]